MHSLECQAKGGGCLMDEKTKFTGIRIPQQIREKLAEQAKAEGRSLSQVIIRLLSDRIDRQHPSAA